VFETSPQQGPSARRPANRQLCHTGSPAVGRIARLVPPRCAEAFCRGAGAGCGEVFLPASGIPAGLGAPSPPLSCFPLCASRKLLRCTFVRV